MVPGVCMVLGGAWWRLPPPDAYCCGRYASYWNAFLFLIIMKDERLNVCNLVKTKSALDFLKIIPPWLAPGDRGYYF